MASENVTVHTKPASQRIEDAIRQQFISKLQSPAARAGCRAECKIGADGLAQCEVAAYGPYSKQKRFQSHGEKNDWDDPCPGLTTYDPVSIFFIYRPADSKTKFLFFKVQDEIDGTSLSTWHFLPELEN